MEACRIVIVERSPGVNDVGAPMKHKDLCYDILKDARRVIGATQEMHFRPAQNCLTIVMDLTGRVDVAAPLPPRAKCEAMLRDARAIIERYDDAQAPVLRPFSDKLVGPNVAPGLQ